MKKLRLYFISILSLVSTAASAQHQNHIDCGTYVTPEENAQFKERLRTL